MAPGLACLDVHYGRRGHTKQGCYFRQHVTPGNKRSYQRDVLAGELGRIFASPIPATSPSLHIACIGFGISQVQVVGIDAGSDITLVAAVESFNRHIAYVFGCPSVGFPVLSLVVGCDLEEAIAVLVFVYASFPEPAPAHRLRMHHFHKS
jgi:hypothetical protein